MSSSAAPIRLENVSKMYKKGALSLRSALTSGLRKITGRGHLDTSEFWALKDVSFEVPKGETLGIIGPNGAGKSTILKLLSGITEPSEGKVTVNGRLAALIEVGAGFHPDMTGRENIYLNGSIMGMTRKEIDRKYDSIVEFAELAEFIDTPVKRYSSGMYVRLGFSVAVHTEPEILLVDEVLAVGDAKFRRKSLAKMSELLEGGTSVVLVSHDLTSIAKFSSRVMLLESGEKIEMGDPEHVIQTYQKRIMTNYQNTSYLQGITPKKEMCTGEVEITRVDFLDAKGVRKREFSMNESMVIAIECMAMKDVKNPQMLINLWSHDGVRVCTWATHFDYLEDYRLEKGHGVVQCRIGKLAITPNKYYLNVGVYDETRQQVYDWWDGVTRPDLSFLIEPNKHSTTLNEYPAICHLENDWVIDGAKLAKTALPRQGFDKKVGI